MAKYRAIVTSSTLLLGGTRRHVSTWFDTREEAERWAEVVVETNQELVRHRDIKTVIQERK